MRTHGSLTIIQSKNGQWWVYSHLDHSDWGVKKFEGTHWFNSMFTK